MLPDVRYGSGNTAESGNVIVFDEDAVIETHSVVVRTTHTNGIFFNNTPSRCCLARVHEPNQCPLEQSHVCGYIGGDA